MKKIILGIIILNLLSCTNNNTPNSNIDEPTIDISSLQSGDIFADVTTELFVGTASSSKKITKSFNLKNNGMNSLNLTIDAISSSNGFSLTLNRCSLLEKNKTCALTVGFSSKNLFNGDYSDNLIVRSGNQSLSIPLKASITNQVNPNTLLANLSFELPGFESGGPTRSLTVKNNGPGDANNILFSIPPGFAIWKNSCPATLKSSKSCSIIILNQQHRSLVVPPGEISISASDASGNLSIPALNLSTGQVSNPLESSCLQGGGFFIRPNNSCYGDVEAFRAICRVNGWSSNNNICSESLESSCVTSSGFFYNPGRCFETNDMLSEFVCTQVNHRYWAQGGPVQGCYLDFAAYQLEYDQTTCSIGGGTWNGTSCSYGPNPQQVCQNNNQFWSVTLNQCFVTLDERTIAQCQQSGGYLAGFNFTGGYPNGSFAVNSLRCYNSGELAMDVGDYQDRCFFNASDNGEVPYYGSYSNSISLYLSNKTQGYPTAICFDSLTEKTKFETELACSQNSQSSPSCPGFKDLQLGGFPFGFLSEPTTYVLAGIQTNFINLVEVPFSFFSIVGTQLSPQDAEYEAVIYDNTCTFEITRQVAHMGGFDGDPGGNGIPVYFVGTFSTEISTSLIQSGQTYGIKMHLLPTIYQTQPVPSVYSSSCLTFGTSF